MLRELIDAGWRAEPEAQKDSRGKIGRLMSRIYDMASERGDSFTVYIGLLLRGCILNNAALSRCSDGQRPQVITERQDIGSITWDELVMICPAGIRKTLHMTLLKLRADQWTGPSKAGVFTNTQDGAFGLGAYLEACREDNSFFTRVTLEECLLFATILNDSKTVLGLLEFGVDPHISSLSNNLEQYHKGLLPWNPSIVAAAAGHLDVLSLLLSRMDLSSFLEFAPIHEIVRHEALPRSGKFGTELCRLANLHRSRLVAEGDFIDRELQVPDAAISIGKNLETLEYIRKIAHSRDCGHKIDLAIIKAAVTHQPRPLPRVQQHLPCEALLMEGLIDANLDYNEKGMDLLHLSIRNHCSFAVVRFLSGKGFKVHSKPGGHVRTRCYMTHCSATLQTDQKSSISCLNRALIASSAERG